jgi:hypothetical protein
MFKYVSMPIFSMAKQKEVRSKKESTNFNAVKKIVDRIMEEDKWILSELAKH